MRNSKFITGLVILLIAGFSSQAKNLTANVATISITPPLEMKYTLGGYGERMNKPAEAIHDPVLAKALVLKKNNHKYAIITLDLLGIPNNFKTDLVKRVADRGWSVANMMLLPSHSHGSFEMGALNSKNMLNSPQIGIYQPELLKFVIDKLELLMKEADQNYQPVTIGTKSIVLEGLNRNRRKDPEVDKEMTLTRVDLKNGKPLAVLVNWTAHPTFIGGKDMKLSAEWPGYLQSELQNLIGKGITAMYYNGAEGDQSAVLNASGNSYDKIQVYGKLIAQKAFDLYKEVKTKNIKDFTSGYQVIKLPEHAAHPSFMKTGGDEYGLDEKTVKFVMNMLGPTEVGLGTVKIGNFMLTGVPGEMTAVLGLEIKKSLLTEGVKYVAIGGLANEWISYILSKEQYVHGEGYESSMSFYGPELGPILTSEIIKYSLPLCKSK